jgi:hypothetical protein
VRRGPAGRTPHPAPRTPPAGRCLTAENVPAEFWDSMAKAALGDMPDTYNVLGTITAATLVVSADRDVGVTR